MDQNYLKQRLLKHKSEDNFKKISNKKSPNKQVKMHETQKVRKLVSHPKIPKQYPKATTLEEKRLTKQVKKVIKESRQQNWMGKTPAKKANKQ